MATCKEENNTKMNGAISCSSCLVFFLVIFWLSFRREGFGTLSLILMIPVLSSLAAILTNLTSMDKCDPKNIAPGN